MARKYSRCSSVKTSTNSVKISTSTITGIFRCKSAFVCEKSTKTIFTNRIIQHKFYEQFLSAQKIFYAKIFCTEIYYMKKGELQYLHWCIWWPCVQLHRQGSYMYIHTIPIHYYDTMNYLFQSQKFSSIPILSTGYQTKYTFSFFPSCL